MFTLSSARRLSPSFSLSYSFCFPSPILSPLSLSLSRSSSVISFKDVHFEYSQLKPLLSSASFSIEEGSKVTLMGQNGSGKSTMLKLIRGELSPDSGLISVPTGIRIASSQQVMKKEDSLLSILEYFQRRAPWLERGIEKHIHHVLDTVELEATLTRQVKTFSGGQQARLLLAGALIQEPDLLLLDEPTNNLDVAGIDRLIEIILASDKTFLVISHDETFLNTFTDSVLYLDSFTHHIEAYDGNYDDVKREISKRIQKENQINAALSKAAQDKKDQSNKFKDKGGGLRSVAKRMRDEAAKMEEKQVDVRREDKALKNFTIPCQSGVNGELIDISAVSLPTKEGNLAVMPIQFPFAMKKGSRLQLKGPNGIGKTTLLENIVKGRIAGCSIPSGLEVGYYRQDFSTLDMEHTVLESLREVCPNISDESLRKTAGAFHLTGQIVYQKIHTLSEGQKGLCAFARLVIQEPALLIMDEPTNHINFRHLPAIADALNRYEGALIVVSHDRSFVEKIQIDKVMDLGEERERYYQLMEMKKRKSRDMPRPSVSSPASILSSIKESDISEKAHEELIAGLTSLFDRTKLGVKPSSTRHVTARSLKPDGTYKKKIFPNLHLDPIHLTTLTGKTSK